MRRWLVLITVTLLVSATALLAKEKDSSAAEAKLKAEAGKTLAEYAAWCAAQGAKTEGGAALAEATSLDREAPKLAETKTSLEDLTEDAAGAADAVAKQRKAVAPKIAALYDKLGGLDHTAKDASRFDDYLFKGLAWDPSAPRFAKIRRAMDDALGTNRLAEGGSLLVRLKRADPDGVAAGRYEKTELELATKDVLLLGSDTHALVGYVSLPRDWAKGKSFPILIDVDGAGSGFLGSCRAFATARGSRSVILLAPMTLSNTNELKSELYPSYSRELLDTWAPNRLDFDGPGVDALLDVIRKRFGGEEKVFLTGFSGGGKYTYWKLFHDPAHVRGASPACANFDGSCIQGTLVPVTDGGPPVHLLTGENDPHKDHVFNVKPGIEGQTDSAQENLRKLGYTRIERTMVKGAGHDAMPAQVWKFIDQVMGAK